MNYALAVHFSNWYATANVETISSLVLGGVAILGGAGFVWLRKRSNKPATGDAK